MTPPRQPPAAWILRPALVAGLLLAAGCTTLEDEAPLRFTGDPVQDARPRDKVLVEYREGLAALRAGKFEQAKTYLDDALRRMGGLLSGPDAAAARARGLFTAESSKNFIGEPYERAMAYYYRGLLYWRDGEIDNARACFRSAQLCDSEAEGAEHRGDFVILDYLAGLASAKLGGDGSDALARAAAHSRRELPPYDPTANVVVFAEFGQGPRKYAGGDLGEQLRFRTADSRVRSAKLAVAGEEVALLPWDDLNYQATTRGGRVMDYVLGRKAVFKQGAEAVGDVALVGAVIAAQNIYRPVEKAPDPKPTKKPAPKSEAPSGRLLAAEQEQARRAEEKRKQEAEKPQLEKNEDAANLALALGTLGVVAKAISVATTPEADTRTWDNLPQYLSTATLSLPAGTHEATVEFFDAGERRIDALTRKLTVAVNDANRDTFIFLSELPR
jgi:tetratricopeptide (TPR) repeat protein